MVPFITEQVWQELVIPADSSAVASVHLSNFPVTDAAVIDRELGKQVALTRRIVELGRASRAESGIKIRQPLGRALIAASGWHLCPNKCVSRLPMSSTSLISKTSLALMEI
jgi:isoleucyl-tRNA synthetase